MGWVIVQSGNDGGRARDFGTYIAKLAADGDTIDIMQANGEGFGSKASITAKQTNPKTKEKQPSMLERVSAAAAAAKVNISTEVRQGDGKDGDVLGFYLHVARISPAAK
jgi:hypothetical protein